MPVRPRGLVSHKNGTYYLRVRIPADLLAWAEGKGLGKEIWKSLHTSNLREAVERFHVEHGKLQADWRARRQRVLEHTAERYVRTTTIISELTPELLELLATHVEAAALAGDEARRMLGYTDSDKDTEGRPPAYTDEEIEAYQRDYADVLDRLRKDVARGEVKELRPLCDEFLRLYGYESRLGELDSKRLAIAYGRAAIRTNEKLLRRYNGEDIATPSIALKQSPMLSDVIADYVKQYDVKKGEMLKKLRSVMPVVLDVVGDRQVHTLKQSDITGLFDVINKLPPHWNVIARQRGLTVRQVADLGLEEIHKNTFDGTYLAAIAPFLDWCHSNRLDEGFPPHLNLKSIRYRGDREEDESNQRAYKANELKRLFEGVEMYALSQSPDELHKFWLPHVGLFTGARVNELCQLNPQLDVIRCPESSIWYFNITHDTETAKNVKKTLKTAKSRRAVPIHSRLIEIGFLDYVGWMKKRGEMLLFSPFIPINKRAAGKAQQWFREFLEELGLRDETLGGKLTGMHAFRSNLLSRAADLGVEQASTITGHASATKLKGESASEERKSAVQEKYEGPRALEFKRRILEKIDWPELKLYTPRRPG